MNNRVTVIAEAGVNHNGSLQIARKLIEAAADAGADYVKFQTFKADRIASRHAAAAIYQKSNAGVNDQLSMLRQLELSDEAHIELQEYCSKAGIRFLSTPFDLQSIDLLKSLNVDTGKIPSGEITNLPFLRKMAGSFHHLILSTGMSTSEEIAAALDVLKSNGADASRITILHCNTEYPTPFEDVNLRAMQSLASTFKVRVGYSDHTVGIEVPIAAVAMGAAIIEKHFTLDRNMPGPDHKASLQPEELKAMVLGIRNIEKALGNAEKIVTPSEEKNIHIARKSIVAAIDIEEGELFTEQNLTTKRPGSGISPMQWDEVIGQKARRSFRADELIEM